MPPDHPYPFRDVVRALRAAGFAEVSQVGSHVKYARSDPQGRRTVIVPHHREVAAGTLRSVLRQAGMT